MQSMLRRTVQQGAADNRLDTTMVSVSAVSPHVAWSLSTAAA
jgi:hypothetical protein